MVEVGTTVFVASRLDGTVKAARYAYHENGVTVVHRWSDDTPVRVHPKDERVKVFADRFSALEFVLP